jgi:hypothetical protein
MSWDEMQALFAAIYVDDIAAAQRQGGKALVREKLAALSDEQRQVLREALLDPSSPDASAPVLPSGVGAPARIAYQVLVYVGVRVDKR